MWNGVVDCWDVFLVCVCGQSSRATLAFDSSWHLNAGPVGIWRCSLVHMSLGAHRLRRGEGGALQFSCLAPCPLLQAKT